MNETSCSKCRNKRMCHKRRDADTKLDELVEIAGRDMISLSQDQRNEVVYKVGICPGSGKGAYLQEIVAKLLRGTLFVSLARLCSVYEEENVVLPLDAMDKAVAFIEYAQANNIECRQMFTKYSSTRITVREFLALPDSSEGAKVGDCFVPDSLREKQQDIKAGDKVFVMQLKKVEADGIHIELVMFTLCDEAE